jgi:Amt family ammonium transporter
MLAGLVAITAPCAFVSSISACIIGIIAGIIVVESVFFVDRVIKVDDPVGAISVHGVNGAWGTIALGLFADGSYGDGWNGVKGTVTGLFYGDSGQLVAQCIGLIACVVYLAPAGYIVFKISDLLCGIRVPVSVEIEGLDIPEMGVPGYSGVVLDKASETPLPQDSIGNSGSSMPTPSTTKASV